MAVKGLDGILRNIDEVQVRSMAKVKVAMEVALEVLKTEYQHQMQVMIYSTPESPNYRRTHNLQNAVFVKVITDIYQGLVTGVLYNGMEYAPFVELGTVRMAARPCLQAAIEASWNEVLGILSEVLDVSGVQRAEAVIWHD